MQERPGYIRTGQTFWALIDLDEAAYDRSGQASLKVRWRTRVFGPSLLASFFLVLNHAGTFAGLLSPPPGYVANVMPRSTDLSQYVTWMHAFQHATVIPDYHAPWLTEPALFNPALWLIAQVALGLHIDVRVAYFLFQYILYFLAAYALFFTIRSFTDTTAQARAAFLVAFLAVPVQSLLALPQLLLSARMTSLVPQLPGIGDFVWMSSDGFFHGICGSALVTVGTATTLLIFGLLAQYFT